MFREHLRYIGKGKSEQSPGNFHEDRQEPLSTLVVNRNRPQHGASLRALRCLPCLHGNLWQSFIGNAAGGLSGPLTDRTLWSWSLGGDLKAGVGVHTG